MPQYVWTPPTFGCLTVCFGTPYVWMPPVCLDTPIYLDAPIYLDPSPVCLDAQCLDNPL